MPYISTEEVKAIRNNIKKAFPSFKVSVTRRHHSSVCVDFLSGPLDFGTTYQQVNHYYINSNWAHNLDAQAILNKTVEIIEGNKETVTEHYDSDYGSVPNFYTNISIGKWDRPYQVQ